MKIKPGKSSWSLAVALAAGLLSAGLTQAAEAPPGNRPQPSERGRPAGGRLGGLALDDQQRQLFREALEKDRDQMARLGEKLRAAQSELLGACMAPDFDEKAVRAKAEVVAGLQAELTVLRARAFATVVPTLTPEQREQLESSPMGAALLSSGWMDFGGRRDQAAPPRGDRRSGR